MNTKIPLFTLLSCLLTPSSVVAQNLVAAQTSVVAQTPVVAQASAEQGRAIALKVQDSARQFQDVVSTVEMVTTESDGKTSVNEMSIKLLQQDNGSTTKSLIVFQKPVRQKGVALLTHSHENKDDQQWLYLPNTRRVKQLADSGRKGSFMGSEFTYNDLVPQSVEDYDYTLLGEESFNGAQHWLLERTPRASNAAFKKHKLWVDKKTLIASKTEFYDTNGGLQKTLTAEDFQTDTKGRVHPAKLSITNHKSRRNTVLADKKYQTDTGLKDTDFTEMALSFSK